MPHLRNALPASVRNTCSLLDGAQHRWLGWGGEREGLWATSLAPLLAPAEMGHRITSQAAQVRGTLQARGSDELPDRERINRADAHTALKPLLPALLLGKKVAKRFRKVLTLIAKRAYLHRENLSKPRKSRPKDHKHMRQKHC